MDLVGRSALLGFDDACFPLVGCKIGEYMYSNSLTDKFTITRPRQFARA